MAVGPGKYDKVATDARTQTKAQGVILIVVGGEHGDGFSAQLTLDQTLMMPTILRRVADAIERDGATATGLGTT
jgi:hypothetical protein